MKTIFTYPDNLATDYISTQYLGNATSGFYKRANDLKLGNYKPWSTTAPTANINQTIQHMSKYHNAFLETWNENTIYKFWELPLYECKLELVNSGPLLNAAPTPNTAFSQPINFTFSQPHELLDGERVFPDLFNGDLTAINGMDVYVKKLSDTELQLSTNSGLTELLEYWEIDTDTITSATSADPVVFTSTGYTISGQISMDNFDGDMSVYNTGSLPDYLQGQFWVQPIDADTFNLSWDSAGTSLLGRTTQETDNLNPIKIVATNYVQGGGARSSFFDSGQVTIDLGSSTPLPDGSLMNYNFPSVLSGYPYYKPIRPVQYEPLWGVTPPPLETSGTGARYKVLAMSPDGLRYVWILDNAGGSIYGGVKEWTGQEWIDKVDNTSWTAPQWLNQDYPNIGLGYGKTNTGASNPIDNWPLDNTGSEGKVLWKNYVDSADQGSIWRAQAFDLDYLGWTNNLNGTTSSPNTNYPNPGALPTGSTYPRNQDGISTDDIKFVTTEGQYGFLCDTDWVDPNNANTAPGQSKTGRVFVYGPSNNNTYFGGNPIVRGVMTPDYTAHPALYNQYDLKWGQNMMASRVMSNSISTSNCNVMIVTPSLYPSDPTANTAWGSVYPYNIDYTRSDTGTTAEIGTALTPIQLNVGTQQVLKYGASALSADGLTFVVRGDNYSSGPYPSLKSGGIHVYKFANNTWTLDSEDYQFTSWPFSDPDAIIWGNGPNDQFVLSDDGLRINISRSGPSGGQTEFVSFEQNNPPPIGDSSWYKLDNRILVDYAYTGLPTNPVYSAGWATATYYPFKLSQFPQRLSSVIVPANRWLNGNPTSIPTGAINSYHENSADLIARAADIRTDLYLKPTGVSSGTEHEYGIFTSPACRDINVIEWGFFIPPQISGTTFTMNTYNTALNYPLPSTNVPVNSGNPNNLGQGTVKMGRNVTLVPSTTGTIVENSVPSPWEIGTGNQGDKTVYNGKLTMRLQNANPYNIKIDKFLPGNLKYRNRTGANTYGNAAYITNNIWYPGATSQTASNPAIAAALTVNQDSEGYVTSITYDSSVRFASPDTFMLTIGTLPDTYTPPAPSPAEEEDQWSTFDAWADYGFNRNKNWPTIVTPSKAQINYNMPTIVNNSQNGIKYTRSSGFTKWTLDVEYPPMTSADFQIFHAFAQAAQGQAMPFYFKLVNKDNNSILWKDFYTQTNTTTTPRVKDAIELGDTTALFEGFASDEANAFITGEVFIDGNNENGFLHTSLSGTAANVFGEAKIRTTWPFRSPQGVGQFVYKDPQHAVVTLNSDDFSYRVDTAGYYYVSVAFDLDSWK